jgi:hypothetical protein
VAEDARQRERDEPRLHAQVGVAHAGGDHAYHDLVVGGPVQGDLFDGEGLAGAVHGGRAGDEGHGASCGFNRSG